VAYGVPIVSGAREDVAYRIYASDLCDVDHGDGVFVEVEANSFAGVPGIWTGVDDKFGAAIEVS